jgi:hypothetical protein
MPTMTEGALLKDGPLDGLFAKYWQRASADHF